MLRFIFEFKMDQPADVAIARIEEKRLRHTLPQRWQIHYTERYQLFSRRTEYCGVGGGGDGLKHFPVFLKQQIVYLCLAVGYLLQDIPGRAVFPGTTSGELISPVPNGLFSICVQVMLFYCHTILTLTPSGSFSKLIKHVLFCLSQR